MNVEHLLPFKRRKEITVETGREHRAIKTSVSLWRTSKEFRSKETIVVEKMRVVATSGAVGGGL